MTPEKWFARRFDAQPASRYAVILERLRGTPARLDERLRDVPAATLTRHAEGAWSAQEHVYVPLAYQLEKPCLSVQVRRFRAI